MGRGRGRGHHCGSASRSERHTHKADFPSPRCPLHPGQEDLLGGSSSGNMCGWLGRLMFRGLGRDPVPPVPRLLTIYYYPNSLDIVSSLELNHIA